MLDEIGGKRGRGIHENIRQSAHVVRRVRNYWAHESDEVLKPMRIDVAIRHLHRFLSNLPDEWG